MPEASAPRPGVYPNSGTGVFKVEYVHGGVLELRVHPVVICGRALTAAGCGLVQFQPFVYKKKVVILFPPARVARVSVDTICSARLIKPVICGGLHFHFAVLSCSPHQVAEAVVGDTAFACNRAQPWWQRLGF